MQVKSWERCAVGEGRNKKVILLVVAWGKNLENSSRKGMKYEVLHVRLSVATLLKCN